MKVEVWSDYACPFCYIGKKRLEKAIEENGVTNVEVEFKSFELDPTAPAQPTMGLYEILASKYGTSVEQAQTMSQGVVDAAKADGLMYEMDRVIPANTFKAHRLTQFAKKHGKMDEVSEGLFQAYFMKGENLNDDSILTRIATEAGLETASVEAFLSSDESSDEVRQEEDMARELGVTGVPFFVFDRKYAISGAQPVEAFSQVLDRVQQEQKVEIVAEGDACGVDGCN
ncbi:MULTISPECIES: DsbA family oxidoreductase [Exiguobacterium]|uniref:DsbA family oxidoreductase n=1 Tax=Exiguobacterium antarcticum TaxID=132920 RepID=A0ABT6R478_9BACL|nr:MULTISPECIES: DsbA family oxidoreductase [Exiguobacterium]AFS69836.1 DSBA oxidoreductase [Exiguobacterium antarcticum B7]MCT4780952.1 DsbA family oxidoreductase [Exiguobacterium soli]MDI3235630.1 DsbA family oxidoreductase [Exiguobacterium antarcticum]